MLINTEPKPNIRLALKVSDLSVGAWYDRRSLKTDKCKPGPKSVYSDVEVLQALRKYIAEPIFYLEGYKKLKVRLKEEYGIDVGKERLRRIMTENELLCHQKNRSHPLRYHHDGKIITDCPNQIWGMDIKEFHTCIGKIYLFDISDHFNSEIKGWYVNTTSNANDAMQALRNAVRAEFGNVAKDVCKGTNLKLRVDHGTQFDSKAFEDELNFLSILKSSAFVRSPQSNGVIERFHRTLKEQLTLINTFKNIDEIHQNIHTFVAKYNQKWLLHRLKLQSPLKYKEGNPSGNTEPEGVRH
jgi:putative transposase